MNMAEAVVPTAEGEVEKVASAASRFHSCGGIPSKTHQESYANIPNYLRMRDLDDPSQFMHRIVDSIIGRDVDLFSEYMSNVGNDARALDAIVDGFKLLFTESSSHDISPSDVLEDLEVIGLDRDVAKAVAEVWYSRKEEIREALVDSIPAMAENHLVNFDWNVGVIMASDKLSFVREPVVQLNLNLAGTQKTGNNVLIEFKKDQLDSFLQSLSEAEKALQKIAL